MTRSGRCRCQKPRDGVLTKKALHCERCGGVVLTWPLRHKEKCSCALCVRANRIIDRNNFDVQKG